MAPITSKKGLLTTTNYNYTTATATANDEPIDSADSNSPTPSSQPSSTDPGKSQCSSLGSDCEFFEGYGLNDGGPNAVGSADNNNSSSDGNNNLSAITGAVGVELDLAPQNSIDAPCANSTILYGDGNLNLTSRDNWTRRSLRRINPSNPEVNHRRWGSMRHSGRRQISTNALASKLYRSSSFNSSGPSSNGDTTEDMHSDISLDNVQDINYKLELLQRQVTDLADTQTISEDRTARTKTEYAVLQARYHMLEEQFRETELRAEERLLEEQKRYREMIGRVEREADLQTENCQIKVRNIEVEANALREENQRLRVLCDKQANDLHRTEEKLELAQDQIVMLQQDLDEAKKLEAKYEDEKKATEDLMLELSVELERLRAETGPALPTTSPETIRLEELHQELEEMRQKNKALEEQNEELQAVVLTRGVEEGRHLLNGTQNSLAQELEEMSQTQASEDSITLASFNELKKTFQEKEEENTRLKHYIDTILLNIVENYPQLLEVKPIAAGNSGNNSV